MIRYAELMCRTHYSFLRGGSHPSELVNRARELGLTALAITDRDGVYGIPKAYRAVQISQAHPTQKLKLIKLKLIVGAELTLENERDTRLHLLARDRAGYGLLCRLLTASHEERPKGKAGLPFKRFLDLMDQSGREGLMAILSCEEEAHEYVALKEVFSDRIYLGLCRVLDGRDKYRTQKVLQLSRDFEIPLVAVNDVHFHIPERKPVQDILTAIRENGTLDEVGFKIFPNAERHLKSPEEMQLLFQDLPEALENTIRIADSCHFSPSELRYYYPSEWIPKGETAQSYLEKQTWEGAKKRFPDGIPGDVSDQLKHELKLIQELKFADYFLTIWEIVEFARMKKILCQGRGSAANSAVCFCLGITAIDPVRMNLLFERFISVERGEPPDIDVDFEHERREEVIQYIYEKYGRDRAGMVAAVITYRTRSASRDVRKALGKTLQPEEKLKEKLEEQPTEKIRAWIEELKGFPRHLSIHSGGFTLSAQPLIETVPIEPARMEGRTVVQWDKDDLDFMGLLKVDLLALGMLTALQKTLSLLQERRPDLNLSLATLPAGDLPTYDMICRGETVGVFQIESRAQMSMLRRLLPRNFYDLVIEIAIVRPGPIQGQMVHPYLKRRRGLESSQSPDPRLEPILSRTLGVPLFQEQVMKIAIVMADFTPGEADELRRAIGGWRSQSSLEKMGMRLKKGLLEKGLSSEFVERLFKQIQGFAEYGFPESHSASFAILAYASSYLKRHFPAEFTCALLNSQPMGFYSCHTLIEEAKRQGVVVLPVHPGFSEWDCTLEGEAIRLGWRLVRGLGREQADRLVQERKERKFRSLADFLSRVKLPQSILYQLALGGAFAAFGVSEREALWKILAARVLSPSPSFREVWQQLNLFAGVEGALDSCQVFQPLSAYEAVCLDYQAYGVSTRGHPLWALRKEPVWRRRLPSWTSQTMAGLRSGLQVRLAGLVIVRQRPPTAKGTVFLTLEDEYGFADLIVHEKVYKKYQSLWENDPFLIVIGRVQRDGLMVNLIVSQMEPLWMGDFQVKSHDFH